MGRQQVLLHGPKQVEEVSFLPMFLASLKAAAVCVGAQIVLTFWLAVQTGAEVTVKWLKILPYLSVETESVEDFLFIIKWSSILTACILAVFAVVPFVRKYRLQKQLGLSFSWLDIALIGLSGLLGSVWFENHPSPSLWMWYLFFAGCAGFLVSGWLVYDTWQDRQQAKGQFYDFRTGR